jgi:uncharacterized membrane protein YkoI
MVGFKHLALVVMAFAAAPSPGFAAEPMSCLSPQERRDAIAAKQAVPLARAVSAVRRRVQGDVVRAQLCRQDRGLVYMLTVLSHNGRVIRATLDATSARFLEQR